MLIDTVRYLGEYVCDSVTTSNGVRKTGEEKTYFIIEGNHLSCEPAINYGND